MPTIEADISKEAEQILEMLVEKGRYESYGEIIEDVLGLREDDSGGTFERGGEGTGAFQHDDSGGAFR